jgi:hypothetical protein
VTEVSQEHSVRVVGGQGWYSISSFDIVFSVGDTVRFKNTVAGRTYVVRGTDSLTKTVKLEGYGKWHDTSKLVMVQCKNTSKKEGSMAYSDHIDHDELCAGCMDCCGDVDYDDACDDCQEHRDDNCGVPLTPPVPTNTNAPTSWSTINKGGSSMGLNTTIASMYEQTADAVLVNKFYGHEIPQNDTSKVLFGDKADEILEAAKSKQSKEDAQRNVVRAQITE